MLPLCHYNERPKRQLSFFTHCLSKLAQSKSNIGMSGCPLAVRPQAAIVGPDDDPTRDYFLLSCPCFRPRIQAQHHSRRRQRCPGRLSFILTSTMSSSLVARNAFNRRIATAFARRAVKPSAAICASFENLYSLDQAELMSYYLT